jgi:capsular polysaccharide biosynthesis protein
VITSNADNSLLPSNGFYHWLLEDLPLYLKLQKVKRQEGILFNTFVYNGAPKYVIDFLNWMGVDVKFLPRLASFGELDFITRGDDAGWPRCEDVEILRDTFSPLFHPKKPTKKIYIPRTKASRSPSYEIELTNILAANDWTILYPETQSLIEQIQIISEAEVLCGVHGAGLAGMIWMEGSAKVIEISRETLGRACFARLANICGLNYFWISDMSKNVDELFEVISKLSEPETMGN